MRRKYKLLLIIIVSIIFAYLIYLLNKEDKINITSFGDGVSSGETAYHIDGISYNDYIKEYYESRQLLKDYNKDYSKINYKINDFLNDIENNHYNKTKDTFIDQIIYKSDIITMCFGEDELTKLSMTNDLTEENIKRFLSSYDKTLDKMKKLTQAQIVVIGLYENDFLDKKNVIIINAELANIVNKYNNIFINIADLMLNEEYFLNKNSYYFSYLGHETLSKIIIHSL